MLIVGYGDSITAGVFLEEEETYLFHLGSRYGCDTVNAGVPGQTSSKAMERLQAVLELQADICIVEFGMNDHVAASSNMPKVTIPAFKQNLQTICKQLIQKGVKPVLCTIHPIIEGDASHYYYARHPQEWYAEPLGAQAWIERYNEGIREAAHECQIPVADITRTWNRYLKAGGRLQDLLITLDNSDRDDGVHPNADGHKRYAECISEQIDLLLK
ncbi:SGNH/GDSL hydrolase family protein [Paenibacillus sp. MBLB4367]|uniref:SGNH/GDSL hydrolase family protein n=1 Tax=Paenibacillus sp. MBLB4367 TaxID=3384767 RepID=UPI0039080380